MCVNVCGEREAQTEPLTRSMPLRPAAGKHEPPSPPRQDQQQQQHAHTHSHSLTHPYTHTANGSQGASTDSSSSREEDSGVPISVCVPAFRPGAVRSDSARAPMEEPTGNTVVIRIGIPDLQQTVRACSVGTVEERMKERGAASPPFSLTGCLLLLCCLDFCFFFFISSSPSILSFFLHHGFFILSFCIFIFLLLPFLVCTLEGYICLVGSGGSTPPAYSTDLLPR